MRTEDRGQDWHQLDFPIGGIPVGFAKIPRTFMRPFIPITEKTILAQVLRLPNAEEILTKYNVPCLICPFAQGEMESLTIGQVAKMYGLDVANLIKELNKFYAKRKSPGVPKRKPKKSKSH